MWHGAAMNASNELVRVERHEDGVAVLTISNGRVNALSTALLGEIHRVARELGERPPGAVVLTGGPKLFAAGADITEFAASPDVADFRIGEPERIARIGRSFLEALGAVAALPCPTIAAVSGFALGGGCELAMACDLRIASTRARFGQPEILLGIIPGGGGTQRLARLVGPARAKDLVLSGRQIDAAEALRIGLVDRVVEPDELDAAARSWAGELAAGPAAAMRMAKALIDGGLDGPLEAGLQAEQEAFVEVFATPDATVGVRSFLEHGPGHARFGG